MPSAPYLLVGAICLAMISVALLRRYQYRRLTARELTRQQRAGLRQQRELCQSMEVLLSELEELSARIDCQVEATLARLESALADANRVADGPSRPAATPAAPPVPPAQSDRSCQRIYELARSGATPPSIAQMLGRPIGEVELILNLRQLAGDQYGCRSQC